MYFTIGNTCVTIFMFFRVRLMEIRFLMNIDSLYSVVAAAHLTYAVDGVPDAFSQRGGIMLVAPPEQMKTSIVKCLTFYGDCLVVSDINVKSIANNIRDEIATGRYNTLALTAFEKIYKRDADTASNIEATLCAMMEEGFGHASFEDSRSFVRTAKCLIVGALVESVYKRKNSEWLHSGFARRFLWCHFKLKDKYAISRSILNWEPIIVSNGGLPTLPYAKIPWNVTRLELGELYKMIRNQPGSATPHILLAKILCVMKWMYRHEKIGKSDKAMSVLKDFSECLNLQGGADVELFRKEK